MACVRPVDDAGRTPLHNAAFADHVAMIKLLIHAGADPNCRDAESKTPLHEAALQGWFQSSLALIRGGADANAVDAKGRTALMLAVHTRRPEVVRFPASATEVGSGGARPRWRTGARR